MRIKRLNPGPGQESVWNYPRPPALEDCSKRIRVVAGGVKIADSTNTKRVLETSHRLANTLGRICPPLSELSDDAESYVNHLDEPTPER